MAITLNKIGDSSPLVLAKHGAASTQITLRWNKPVELDLHAFYRTHDGQHGHVYCSNRGQRGKPPFIFLDKEDAIARRNGTLEQHLFVERLEQFESIVIAANIFRFFSFLHAGDNFGRYDGRVIVRTERGEPLEVPLISEKKGRWCTIARIEGRESGAPLLRNINSVTQEEPSFD